jgi:AcrR family transcriptional regulator
MSRAKTTAKSAETRERILRAASELFVEEGFRQATMRRIAEHAGVALGLTYRYFPGKEDLALALYGEIAVRLAARAEQWGALPLAEGFRRAMTDKLELVGPHRGALAAIFAASLEGGPAGEIASVVGPRSAAVRTQVRWVFRRVVERATDLPATLDDAGRADLTAALYGLHLAVLLAWLLAPPGSGATGAMLDAIATSMRQAAPLLQTPLARPMLGGAARWLSDFLGDGPPSSTGRQS